MVRKHKKEPPRPKQSSLKSRITFVQHLIVVAVFGPTPAVLKVEARKVLENFVERLLLVLVALAKPQHLMSAELADLVALEHVILPNPVDLAG